MTQDFAGRSIIVTGGASGIGQATALLLASRGCSVTIADIDERSARETVERIEAAKTGKAQFVRCDVSNEANVAEAVSATQRKFGKLDGAANVAGMPMRGKPLDELSLEEWEHCIAINLRGTFLSIKHQAKAMLASGGGSIVAVGSTASIAAIPNASDYCAAKAGVLGLVRGAAIDYATRGIRVNAVLPGATLTPMLQGTFSEGVNQDAVTAAVAMKRMAQPPEIAAAIVWLLSDAASYVTGVGFPVDGGLTAM